MPESTRTAPRRRRAALAAAVVACPLLAAPALAEVGGGPGAPAARYIVTFDASTPDGHIAAARDDVLAAGGDLHFTYRRAVRGFAATLSDGEAARLRLDPHVLAVEADAPVVAGDVGAPRAAGTQAGPGWNLDRIDQHEAPLDGSYSYPATGAGVSVFVIDSGIRTSHSELAGRVTAGFTAIDDDRGTDDCTGHGTHVAGIIGGSTYGVAKEATLVAVRVLNCAGVGTVASAIAGVDWVTTHHSGLAVANMSLTSPPSKALDAAVARSIASGVTYVVAAGNDNTSACKFSPARVPAALTVGATTRDDVRAGYSNLGRCVDLFAPGSDVESADGRSDRGAAVRSGTSMAAPHVTGTIAAYLEQYPGSRPGAVQAALLAAATTDVLTGLRNGSNNRLLYSRLGELRSAPPLLGPAAAHG